MDDKKIIITAILLIVLIVSLGWYFNWQKEKTPAANILQNSEQISESAPQSPTVAENNLILGKDDAPVTMIEYTNFLCPHCANFAINTLPPIEEKYIRTGQVKLKIIVLGPTELGEAALCSQEQDKFKEYHDYLYEHQSEITKSDDLKIMAKNVGLNKENFDRCLDSQKYKTVSESWLKETQQKQIEGTPTFFISPTNDIENAEKIIGAQPLENFEQAIQKYLPR